MVILIIRFKEIVLKINDHNAYHLVILTLTTIAHHPPMTLPNSMHQIATQIFGWKTLVYWTFWTPCLNEFLIKKGLRLAPGKKRTWGEKWGAVKKQLKFKRLWAVDERSIY